MSVQTSYCFKRGYQAILIALFAMTSVDAFALTLGSPTIQSEQHEPLSATIPVSNIDANTFSTSIAQADVHQQMGMTPTTGLQVRFVKTSDTTGKLVLSSSSPISTPFADVVMNLNDSGQSHLKPQTLLLPISTKGIKPAATAATDIQPELPLVSGHPLSVATSAPPPLFAESLNTTDSATQISDTAQMSDEAVVTKNTPPITDNTPTVEYNKTNENTNAQLEILTKQITTQIIGVVGSDKRSETTQAMPADEPSLITKDEMVQEESATTGLPVQDDGDSTATYVVQSGDNLWKIASEIAKANNLSVEVVMDALHKKNPHAFSGGNINQLKAKAALNIPNYEVIPSQKAIQEAISVRKAVSNKTPKASIATVAGGKTKNKTSQQNQVAQNTKTSTTVKPLPKPQVTLVTPSKSGQATGTNQGIQTHNHPLVGSLKDTRAQVAKKAKKVNNLNEALSSATQKLQLQNQKLAELEARLKALKDK